MTESERDRQTDIERSGGRHREEERQRNRQTDRERGVSDRDGNRLIEEETECVWKGEGGRQKERKRTE